MKTLGNLLTSPLDLMEYAKEEAPVMRQLVNSMIEDKIDAREDIESLLNLLVKYMQLGYCVKDFKKLNKYYFFIDKNQSLKYEQIYRGMFRD